MDPTVIFASILSNCLPQFFTELSAIGEKHEALKRSPLYYLLRLEGFQSDREAEWLTPISRLRHALRRLG
jgi:hypothetical protein